MPANDRRQSERFPVSADVTCGVAGRLIQDLGAVRIKNVSMEGIGLLLGKAAAVGDVLALTLANPGKAFARTCLVRVVHVTPQVGGSHLVGGTFETPLTYQELTTLIM
ncbi:MAG: PilZ domain-containing protein [Gemmataceae bacterium]